MLTCTAEMASTPVLLEFELDLSDGNGPKGMDIALQATFLVKSASVPQPQGYRSWAIQIADISRAYF